MLKNCALISLCACACLAGDFITGQGARLVIGQANFTQQDSGASDTLLGGVGGVAYAADTLFVADSNRIGFTPINNRVSSVHPTFRSAFRNRWRRWLRIAGAVRCV